MELLDKYSEKLSDSIVGNLSHQGALTASTAQIFVFLSEAGETGETYIRETLKQKWKNHASCAYIDISLGKSEKDKGVSLGFYRAFERGEIQQAFISNKEALSQVNKVATEAVMHCLDSHFTSARAVVCNFILSADSPIAVILPDVCAILRGKLTPYSHIVFRLAAHFSDLEPTENAYAFFEELSYMQSGAFEYHKNVAYRPAMSLFSTADYIKWKVFDEAYLCGSISEANTAVYRPFESMCRAFALSCYIMYSDGQKFDFYNMPHKGFRFSTFAYCRLSKPLKLISMHLLSELYYLAIESGRLKAEDIELSSLTSEAVERAVESVSLPSIESMALLPLETENASRARVLSTADALEYLYSGLDSKFFSQTFESLGQEGISKASPTLEGLENEILGMVESGQASFKSAVNYLRTIGPMRANDMIDTNKYHIALLEKELFKTLQEPTRAVRKLGEPYIYTYAKAALEAVYEIKIEILKKKLAISYLRDIAEIFEKASSRLTKLESGFEEYGRKLREATSEYLSKARYSMAEGLKEYYSGLLKSIASSYQSSLPEGAPIFFANGTVPDLKGPAFEVEGFAESLFAFACDALFSPRHDRERGLSLAFDDELKKRAEATGANASYTSRAMEIIKRQAQPALRSVHAYPKRIWPILIGNPESELFIGVKAMFSDAFEIKEEGREDGFEVLIIEEGYAFEEMRPYFEGFTPSILRRMASMKLHSENMPGWVGGDYGRP